MIRLIIVVVLLLFTASEGNTQQLAFPTAEGPGRFSKGGRGTVGSPAIVYNVNSLNWALGTGGSCDAGSCSGGTITLPDCFTDRLNTGKPVTCIFRIGGSIDMNQNPTWNFNMKSNVTIAGQTAPGDGILLKNGGITLCANFNCGTPISDWIIRHLRIAGGQNGGFSGQDLTIYNGHDVIVDHSSLRWATDDTTGITNGSYNITWQWNIIGEGLHDAPSNPGQPSKALLWSGPAPGGKGGIVHNLLANVAYRAPNLDAGNVQLANNIIYNVQVIGSGLTPITGPIHMDFINNYYLRGPNTVAITEGWPNGIYTYGCNAGNTNCTHVQASSIYVNGNYHDLFRPTGTEPQTALVGTIGSPEIPIVGGPTQDNSNITIVSAAQARTDILAKAGAYAVAGGWATVRRDGVDTRQVNDVINLTGRLPQTENAVCNNDLSTSACGFGTYRNGTPYPDDDNDGISNDWEDTHGLNRNNPADAQQIAANGYSNLENFLNDLAGDNIVLVEPTINCSTFATFESAIFSSPAENKE